MGKNNSSKSLQEENRESFIMLSKSLIETKKLGKYGDLDVYHLAVIKTLANNFQGVAFTGVNHLMKCLGMNLEQSSTKIRTNQSLLRLQTEGHIEIYEDIEMVNQINHLKHANIYFIKPTGKDEDMGFAKVFYKDINKIASMNSNYRPKIFATYCNIVAYMFYSSTSYPLSYIKIDTIAKNTGIVRKSIVEYLKNLHEEEIIHCIHFDINNTISKNYYTRWVHNEHTGQWAVGEAEFQYRTNHKKFKGGAIGVCDERGAS